MREIKAEVVSFKGSVRQITKEKKICFYLFLVVRPTDSVTQVCRYLSLLHHCTRVEFQFLNKLTSNTSDKIQCFCYIKSNHLLFFYIPTSQVTMPQGALSSVVQCTEKL